MNPKVTAYYLFQNTAAFMAGVLSVVAGFIVWCLAIAVLAWMTMAIFY